MKIIITLFASLLLLSGCQTTSTSEPTSSIWTPQTTQTTQITQPVRPPSTMYGGGGIR